VILARKPLSSTLLPEKHLAEERRKKTAGKEREKTKEVTNSQSVSNLA